MINAISFGSAYPAYPTYGFSYAKPAERPQNAGPAQALGRTAPSWGVQKAAQPETPVQPVTPARPVDSGEDPARLAMMRYESDPAAMAVRMRIQYPSQPEAAGQSPLAGQEDPTEQAPLAGQEDPAVPQEGQEAKSAQEVMEEAECQTCKERKYQDGSDDPGVSFKTPTNIAPEQVASAVRGHENEHVVREQAKAQREDRKVVSQNVTLHTDICPECGKVYISGGTTRTVTKAADSQPAQNDNTRQSQQQPFSAVA